MKTLIVTSLKEKYGKLYDVEFGNENYKYGNLHLRFLSIFFLQVAYNGYKHLVAIQMRIFWGNRIGGTSTLTFAYYDFVFQ